MIETAVKVLVTAGLVVAISEVGKRSSYLSSIIASLPLTSLLAFIWLYVETGDALKVSSLSKGIFWYVLPSLVLFLLFPVLIANNFGFWPSLTAACAATFAAYVVMTKILVHFGVVL